MECVDLIWILIQTNRLGEEKETMREILLLVGYSIMLSNYC